MPKESRKPINEVLADSLRFWMKRAGIEGQQALATVSGVSQRTISNYLNPAQRLSSSRGKAPSAKLAEVEQIADALGVAVWELLRSGSEAQREAYRETEELIRRIGARRQSDSGEAKRREATTHVVPTKQIQRRSK